MCLIGRLITELRVPGIKFGFVKRPHDIGLQVQVQDLFLVDRIQTFGPGYELVICSSGSTLLDFVPSSPLANKDEEPFNKATNLLSPDLPPQEQDEFGTHPEDLDYSVFSNDGLPIDLFSTSLEKSEHALLVLSYSLLTPNSPQHPAVRDRDEDDVTSSVGDEPNIHRVSLECTAVDAIGKR